MNLLERLDPGGPVVRLVLGALLQTTAVILLAALVAGTVPPEACGRAAQPLARHSSGSSSARSWPPWPTAAVLQLGVVIVPYPNLEPVWNTAESRDRASLIRPSSPNLAGGGQTWRTAPDNPPAAASSGVDAVSIAALPAPPTKVSTAEESVVHRRGVPSWEVCSSSGGSACCSV